MLEPATNRLRRAGAPVKNLAHSAFFHPSEKTAPPNPGSNTIEDALQPLRPLGDQGRLAPHVRGARGCWRPARRGAAGCDLREGAPQRLERETKECAQAIGRSRGGRTTKIHAAANQGGKPIAFHLSGGSTADFHGSETLIEAVPEGALVIADRAFDADRFRSAIEARGAVPNIPPKANRRWKGCVSPTRYRGRNAIERMFCRLKVFRRVATRYNRLSATYLAAVQIAAIVAFWL
jgi:transposase